MQRLRSVLYVPGSSQRILDKAADIAADALILDLEDAVNPASKAEARERVCKTVAAGLYTGTTVAIRINAIGTEWHNDDMAAAVACRPDAILLPKVNGADDIRLIEQQFDVLGLGGGTALWAMVETPRAVIRAHEIADSGSRLTVLVMGTNDLTNELRAQFDGTRLPLMTSVGLTLVAARAAGLMILDGVYNDVRDLDGFASECGQSCVLGFDGKTLIHPAQVEICNRMFSPSEDAVAHARRVIDAFEEAAQNGAGVATVDGKLVENLHVEMARRTILLAAPRTARPDAPR